MRTLGDVNAGELQKENLTKAVEQFDAILKLDPRDTSSALWLARLYRFENEHAEAEKILRSILQRDPDNGPALEQLSQLLMDAGRSQEAVELLSQAAGSSSSPDIYDLLGDAYSQSKDFAKAEEAYRHALELDPDDPGHHHGLAQALLSQDKYAAALDEYKRLSELEPGTSENYLRMAQLYRRLGKYDESESSLLRAKQLSPGSLEVLYNEAPLYEDQGRYGDAVKVLTDAIAAMKNQSGAEGNPNALAILYEQLGRTYREQENYTAAVETFRKMLTLGDENARSGYQEIIDTYREAKQWSQATAVAKEAVQKMPDDREGWRRMHSEYEAAGATGLVLPLDPRLLDLLRNGDEEDDRSDLQLAQG